MPVVNRVADLLDEITTWRQTMHQHPELGFEEFWTSDFVAARLEEMGIEVHRGMGGTGVVGVVEGARPGKGMIGLRADFDALPLEELNKDLPYISQNPGKMHACGHDGHTAMLLGAAKYLSETRNFSGKAVFIFQPAEEGGGGGLKMIEDGLFEQFPVDAVYGMHNQPGLAIGAFETCTGPIMGSTDEFCIKIEGKGGHAAHPDTTIDVVPVAAHLILALQNIASREIDPMKSVVVSCTMLKAESQASNIISEEVELKGTIRTLDKGVRRFAVQRLQEIAQGVCQTMRATCEIEMEEGYPVTFNHERETDFTAQIASEIVGSNKVNVEAIPTMGAEDFSYMLEEKPGSYIFVGNGLKGEPGGNNLHAPDYNFSDEASLYGTSFWVRLVETAQP